MNDTWLMKIVRKALSEPPDSRLVELTELLIPCDGCPTNIPAQAKLLVQKHINDGEFIDGARSLAGHYFGCLGDRLFLR